MTDEQYKNGQRDARLKSIEDDIKEIKTDIKVDRRWQRGTLWGIIISGGALLIERFLK